MPVELAYLLPIVGIVKVLLDFFADRLVVRPPAPPVVITVSRRATTDLAALDGEPAASRRLRRRRPSGGEAPRGQTR